MSNLHKVEEAFVDNIIKILTSKSDDYTVLEYGCISDNLTIRLNARNVILSIDPVKFVYPYKGIFTSESQQHELEDLVKDIIIRDKMKLLNKYVYKL